MDIEAQFAACLLCVGGPDRLRPRSREWYKNKGIERPHSTDPQALVTTAEYLFLVASWYDNVIEPKGFAKANVRPPRVGQKIEQQCNPPFLVWWIDYKMWLHRNWHE